MCTIVNTSRVGLAAAGRVPSTISRGGLVEICFAAPCRCTIPKLSSYHPGAVDPNPALPDQFAVFSGIGWGIGAAAADAAIPTNKTPAVRRTAGHPRRRIEPRHSIVANLVLLVLLNT